MRIAELVSKGLPKFAVDALAERAILTLDPLQVQAVEAGLFEGRDLMIMAPTSCGKTLIGELAALQHAVSRSGTVILTSHKALAYEKYLTLRESYSQEGQLFVHTNIATGDEVTDERGIEAVGITVATYEKWYYMVVERPDLIKYKSLLIIDELQMLGDPHRGHIVEAILTWTLLRSPNTQILGLSATIPNVVQVANWLQADVVSVDRRPYRWSNRFGARRDFLK